WRLLLLPSPACGGGHRRQLKVLGRVGALDRLAEGPPRHPSSLSLRGALPRKRGEGAYTNAATLGQYEEPARRAVLASDRVGGALLVVAGRGRAFEILRGAVGLAFGGRVLLALRHEALQRGAGELLVGCVALAGGRCAAAGQQRYRGNQGDPFHGVTLSLCDAAHAMESVRPRRRT